ncbi:MAG: polysaccharide deacetylase family protein [FCB group bacterium]|nr:polysaccharide deacetylase family protein [FCB group bacterium]
MSYTANYQNKPVPALTYHKIAKKYELGLNVVSPGRFRSHLQYLKKNRYLGVTTNCQTVQNPLYLTFDDAYECIFTEAFPICLEADFKGIVFVITDFIGKLNNWDINFGINRSRHLTKEQLSELSKAGWEIASHGRKHRAHTGMNVSEILRDMQESRKILEDLFGVSVLSYTPPFNVFLPNLRKMAERAGYHNVFLQKPVTPLHGEEDSLNVIERRMVYSFDTSANIMKKVENCSYYELYKENIIHFCSNATIGVRSLFLKG